MKNTMGNKKLKILGTRKQRNEKTDLKISLYQKKARAVFLNHRTVIVIYLSA